MLKYKTFWRRFFAGIIDWFILIPISIAGAFIHYNKTSMPVAGLAAWHIFSGFVYYAYTILLHAKYGQTVGKMAMNVRVVDVSETRSIGFRQALLRDSVPLLFTFILIPHDLIQLFNGTSYLLNPGTMPDAISLTLSFVMMGWALLEAVTMLTNSKRRAVHDFIAGTVVVRTRVPDAESSGYEQALHEDKKKGKKIFVGCTVTALLFLSLSGIAGYIFYQRVIQPISEHRLEKPPVLSQSGVIIGTGKLVKSVFADNVQMGRITDLQIGEFLADQGPVLAAASSRGVKYYQGDGNLIRHTRFKEHSGDVRLVNPGSDKDHFFVNQGSWGVDASVIDQVGFIRWRYGGKMGVNCMSAGDVDGDGDLEYAVGFNGSGGIHLLNEHGEKIWEKPGGNIWHVEIDDMTGDGRKQIVHSDAGGHMTIRDAEGNVIKSSTPDSYFSHFSLCRKPDSPDRKYCLHAEDDAIRLFDEDGTTLLKYSAPGIGNLGDAYGTPFQYARDENESFAVLVNYPRWEAAILYVHRPDGSLLYQEVLPESCSSILAVENPVTGLDRLLIGGTDTIYAYEQTDDRSP